MIDRANRFKIPIEIFDKPTLTKTDKVLNKLREYQVDWIALAGFMLLVPPSLVEAFPNRIINIHPALLPAYGGKGVYGMNVHRAGVKSKVTAKGSTINDVKHK